MREGAEVDGTLQLQHGEVVVSRQIVVLGVVLDLDHVHPEAISLSIGVIIMLPQQDLYNTHGFILPRHIGTIL